MNDSKDHIDPDEDCQNPTDFNTDANSYSRMDGNECKDEKDLLAFAYTDSEDDTKDEEEENPQKDEEGTKKKEESVKSSDWGSEYKFEWRDYWHGIDFYQKETGVQTSRGELNSILITIGVMDFQFLRGSMRSAVGEKSSGWLNILPKIYYPLL